jgi:hypothetical protein
MESKKAFRILKKLSKLIFIIILFATMAIYFRFFFLFFLLALCFGWKFLSVRIGLDQFGIDPFFFSSFYVGYAYGLKLGLIFALLFWLAFNISQAGWNLRCFYLGIVYLIIAMLSSAFSFIPAINAGLIFVFIGAGIDIVLGLLFFGPSPKIIIVHSGHAIFAYLLIAKILPYMPGI